MFPMHLQVLRMGHRLARQVEKERLLLLVGSHDESILSEHDQYGYVHSIRNIKHRTESIIFSNLDRCRTTVW